MGEEKTSSRAVLVKKFGGYDSLIIKEHELPPLGDKIEIQVKYGGLNFADLYTRQGLIKRSLPFVLGMECVGHITALGTPETTEYHVGQPVICYDYCGGMYSELIRVPKDKVYPIPDNVTLDQASALFVNYMTAHFSLFELGNLKDGETILLMSCAGGTGWAATQLAKTLDVKVFGVTSKLKEDQCKENGVDVVISYDSLKNIPTIYPEGFDLIVTNQTGSLLTFFQTILKPLGRLVMLGANNIIQNEKKLSFFQLMKMWWTTKFISPASLITNSRCVAGLHLGKLAETNSEKMRTVLSRLFQLLVDGKINPKIHAIKPMSEIVEATKLLAERKNVGKVLISMSEE